MTAPRSRIAGAGNETVLLLHGIGGGHGSWSGQIDPLAKRFRTVAWDMPGYGDSAPLTETTLATLAKAALSLLDSLGCARAHLVGHSLGGMIAQEIAARAPARLASLVLYATTASFGKPDGDWQKSFLAARLAPLDRGLTPADIAPQVVASLLGDKPDPAATEAAIATMSRVGSDAYRAALQSLLGFDRRAALAGIGVPTLLIAGEKDRTAPASVMEKMAATIPNARMVVIPGAGHLAHLERPGLFNTALGDFLEGVTAREEAS